MTRRRWRIVLPFVVLCSANALAQPDSPRQDRIDSASTGDDMSTGGPAGPADDNAPVTPDERAIQLGDSPPARSADDYFDGGPDSSAPINRDAPSPDRYGQSAEAGGVYSGDAGTEEGVGAADSDYDPMVPAGEDYDDGYGTGEGENFGGGYADGEEQAIQLGNLTGASGMGDAFGDYGGPGLGFAGAGAGGCGTGVYGDSIGIGNGIASERDRPTGPARAGRRYIRAEVIGTEVYTDNLNLVSDDEAESAYITTVSPRVEACKTTGRVRGEATYQLQGVFYANNSEYNDVYNDVQASTTINVLEDKLFLDANTVYGQQVIDPAFGYARSNIIRPDENRTTAWRSNISPYVNQRLGPLGQGFLRYRYGRSVYSEEFVPETTVQSVTGTIVSPETAEPLSWQASATTQWVESSGGRLDAFLNTLRDELGDDDFTPPGFQDPNRTRYFDLATLELGYRIQPTLQLTVLGGVEDDYKPDGSNDRWSSPRWQVGVRYDNVRTLFEANYGERFGNYSYSLLFNYESALADFELSYQEDPSTGGLDTLNGLGVDQGFGNDVGGGVFGGGGFGGGGYGDGDYGGTDAGGFGGSLFNRNVYLNKRWRGSVRYDTALTTSNLDGFYSQRQALVDGVPDTTYYGLTASSDFDFRPRMSLVPTATWSHFKNDLFDQGSSDLYSVSLGLVRSFTPTAQGAIGYGREWRRGAVEYEENRITLQFRKSF